MATARVPGALLMPRARARVLVTDAGGAHAGRRGAIATQEIALDLSSAQESYYKCTFARAPASLLPLAL